MSSLASCGGLVGVLALWLEPIPRPSIALFRLRRSRARSSLCSVLSRYGQRPHLESDRYAERLSLFHEPDRLADGARVHPTHAPSASPATTWLACPESHRRCRVFQQPAGASKTPATSTGEGRCTRPAEDRRRRASGRTD